MITNDLIERLGRKYRIDNFTILREYLQLVFLKYFYQQPEAGRIYFKGGTAIHFIYQSFRFSEDLDFTSTLDESTTRGLVQRSFVDFSQETTNVALEEQETVKGLKFRIKHQPPETKQTLPIRLDFSFRERAIYTDNSVIESDFPVAPYPLVSHLKAEELLAEKVRALLVRGKPRDAFDIWYLQSKDTPLDKELIRKKLAIYPDLHPTDIKAEIVHAVKQIPETEFRQDLNRFLPENYRNFYQQLPALIEKQREVSPSR
jgi:predicted nucleotidyltransferase component of viral defense system